MRRIDAAVLFSQVLWSRQVATYESGDKSPHSKISAFRAVNFGDLAQILGWLALAYGL